MLILRSRLKIIQARAAQANKTALESEKERDELHTQIKTVTHMMDLQEYGVTKKWVIITEISKEVENNSIARINAYARQYVSRSVRGGESGSEVRVGNGGVGGPY